MNYLMDSYMISLHVNTGCLSTHPNITEVVSFAQCITFAVVGLLVESTPELLFQTDWNHDRHRYEALPFLTFHSPIHPKLPSFLRCFTSITSADFPSGVIFPQETILRKDDFWRAAAGEVARGEEESFVDGRIPGLGCRCSVCLSSRGELARCSGQRR